MCMMMEDPRMNPLFELLQIALGNRSSLTNALTEKEWFSLFDEAQKQAIVGVLIDGIEKLSAQQRPPKVILLEWIGMVQMVENTYALQSIRVKELTNLFSDAGYFSCVLKGHALAQYYPIPSRRQGGDIDLWVDGERENVMKWLRAQCEVEHIVWHHVNAKLFEDVETEIHFHPGWFYNPFKNRILQKWFEGEKNSQMVVNEELGFAYPTVRFNAVYALVHLYHHLIEEGVGIRHIIDYYYILKAMPAQEKKCVVKELKRFGLLKLASATMWVLQEVCGMSSEYLICEPNEKEGRFLLDEIMRGGNFGRFRNDNLLRNTAARMLALLPHYPSEVLWVVPWKLWHKGWRMRNG